MTKTCSKCGKVKDVADFHTIKKRGVRVPTSHCRQCQSEYEEHRWEVDLSHKSKRSMQNKIAKLWHWYNITLKEYTKMLVRQGFRCQICGEDMRKTPKGPCVDLGHKTGKVRGLLCCACNLYLAASDESGVDFRVRAEAYIKGSN